MNEALQTLKIRRAEKNDLEHIRRLLVSADLPTEGIEHHLSGFLIAEVNGSVAGTVGLEVYETNGLLRSAAVLPEHRAKGIGARLVDATLEYAKEKGLKEVLLLTTTAENYFSKWGFAAIDAKKVTGEILASTQFKGACPSTAVCMRKRL